MDQWIYDTLFIIMTFASLTILGIVISKISKIRGIKPKKQMENQNEQAILDHYKTLLLINSDQKETIRSIRQKQAQAEKKIAELEGYDQSEPAEQQITIDPSLLRPLAQKFGINDLQLAGIMQSEEAQKFLKDKKNQRLIRYVLPLLASQSGQDSNGLPPIQENQV